MVCASEDPAHAAHLRARPDYCNVNQLWMTVQRAVIGALDSITLADLATPRPSHPFHADADLDQLGTNEPDGAMTDT